MISANSRILWGCFTAIFFGATPAFADFEWGSPCDDGDGEFEQYEPDYPEEVLERQAFNELFAESAEHDEGSHDVTLPQAADTALPDEGVNLKEYLSELEINLVLQALEQSDWVVARAADKLGMRRTTLVEKMRKYNIQREAEA